MKKLILIASMGMMAAVSYGQGTVTFANATSSYGTASPDHLVRWDGTAVQFNPVLTAGGLVSSNYGGSTLNTLVAQLYYGATSANSLSSLTAVTDNPASFRSSTSANAGAWIGGTRSLIGFLPGDSVTLDIVVYDTSKAGSGSAAAGGVGSTYNGLYGASGLFTYTIPTGNAAPAAFLPNNAPFTVGFTAIPEPTTLALAGLGASALVIFRRRK